jgi:stage V sporulation protein B
MHDELYANIHDQRKPSYLKGAAILAAAWGFVRIIGALYKIPLFQDGVLGDEGTGDFHVTYSVYSLILTISTAGIPTALSRLVSSANAEGNEVLKKRLFSVAMHAFLLIGAAMMLVMFFFADTFASLMSNSMAALGIRVLSPAVFFVCIISVYRGYAQGHENMIPTAVSQIIEVTSKAAFGIAFALWLVSMGYQSHIISAGAIVGVTIGLGLCVPVLMWYKKRLDRNKGVKRESKTGDGSPSETLDGSLHVFDSSGAMPSRIGILGKIMKVSIPITLSASFMAVIAVIVNSIVLRRLQLALELSEAEARGFLGVFTRALTIHNLPPSLFVPVSISIIPAIAAAIARKRNEEASIIMQSSVKLVNLLAMPASAGIMLLATPILIALYDDSRQLTSDILIILGAASLFVCLQFVTTAILQANGHERVALMTFPAGAVLRIILSYILAGNPQFGIMAMPIGTLVCFVVITVLNIIFIKIKIKDGPKFSGVFIKPLMCTAVMAAVVFFLYRLLYWFGSGFIGTGRTAVTIYLCAAIIIGITVYGVLIIATRTVTMEDMKLVPRGEKLARILHIS